MERLPFDVVDLSPREVLANLAKTRLGETSNREPTYTVYIPSKNRSQYNYTPGLLEKEGIRHFIVVEPQDYESYCNSFGSSRIIQMPKNDQGISYARNFIKDYSKSAGEQRHWQIDDDFRRFRVRISDKNVETATRNALTIIEDVSEDITNFGIASPINSAFAYKERDYLSLNKTCYGSVLVDNGSPIRWRDHIVEDLDYALQCLELGLVTLTFKKLMFETFSTGSIKGGNQDNAFATTEARRRTCERTAALWPDRLEAKKLDGKRGWTMGHKGKLYARYTHDPILRLDT